MIKLQGVEGNLSWFYILIRKIEGSILANILNLDSLIGSHPFAHLDVKRPKPASSIWTGCRLYRQVDWPGNPISLVDCCKLT